MSELSSSEKAFLSLIIRSEDKGEGWRSISKTLWPLVEKFSRQELIEVKDWSMVRLSDRGIIVKDYI